MVRPLDHNKRINHEKKNNGMAYRFSSIYSLHAQLYGSFSIVDNCPLIEKELGFNAAEMGMIFSAFFIGYALFNFIGGWASDKVGPKTVFLIAALLWSVFCGLTGLVTGLWTMLIVRVLFGMAEGPVSAAGNKIINNWISRKESATAIGIFSAGSRSAARCPGRLWACWRYP